jgi:4-amino-4-deoxy-L-arabinose transferase-like glycosyltransferase
MLGLLAASAFFMRLQNFQNSRLRTIDEVVYYRMAVQMSRDFFDYNTIPYGKELAGKGRDLPAYFFKPLFKHPPLFTMLNAFSIRLFGPTMVSAEYVSLLCGVLLIPLAYWLGTLLTGRAAGLMAAIFMWLDPITIMASQKIWLDTTVAFFSVLAICLFIYGDQKKKGMVFVLSGVAIGLAVLTKYTGILSLIGIVLYATLYKRTLFQDKKFLSLIWIPFVMLLPWLFWNFVVYGLDFFMEQALSHKLTFNTTRRIYRSSALIVMIVTVTVLIMTQLKRSSRSQKNGGLGSFINTKRLKKRLIFVFGILLLLALHKQAIHSLDFHHIPKTSWRQGVFRGEPPTFFLGRLIEFSFLYTFALASFFIHLSSHIKSKPMYSIASLVVIIFFIIWGNYQSSRYILPAIPFLIVLGVQFFLELLRKASSLKPYGLQVLSKGLLITILIYSIVKTMHLNIVLSYTNDMCFF